MVRFRQARAEDSERIAALHALSWQKTYPGILSQAYLDSEVLNEKQDVWHKRLNASDRTPWFLLRSRAVIYADLPVFTGTTMLNSVPIWIIFT